MKILRKLTLIVSISLLCPNLTAQISVKRTEYSAANGTPKLIEFNTSVAGAKISSKTSNEAFVKAATSNSYQDLLALYLKPDPRVTFVEVISNRDSYGIEHTKFQQYYKNIKVVGGIYNVHSQNGSVVFMNGDFKPIEKEISIVPNLEVAKALDFAKKCINDDSVVFGAVNAPDLVLIDPFLIGKDLRLAYKFKISVVSPDAEGYNTYVDANSGELLYKESYIFKCFHSERDNAQNIAEVNVTSAVSNATFSTRYCGNDVGITDSYNGMYRLRDYSRGSGIETYDAYNLASYNSTNNTVSYDQSFLNAVDYYDYDNKWQEYNNSKKDNAALDVHLGTQKTYDYFLRTFGRNSVDGNGLKLKSYVNLFGNIINSVPMQYSNSRDFAINAYWDGQRMTYFSGDGTKFGPLGSQDVISHELAHGLCQYSANLFYHGESGAINEALSDIWGATIENANYGNAKKTWQIGEDFDLLRGLGFRSMNNPKSLGQPNTYRGQNWIWSMQDNNGVHQHSGVINYWYYLICNGGSGTNDFNVSYDVSPIGINEAATLVYNTEVNLLTEFTGFQDFRMLILQNAAIRYGQSSSQYAAISEAFKAVGITETLLPQQAFYQTQCSLTPNDGDGVFSGDGYVGDGVYTSKTCFTNQATFCGNRLATSPTSFKITFLPGRNTVIEVGDKIGFIAEANRGIINNRDWQDSKITMIPTDKGRIELRVCPNYKATPVSAVIANNDLAMLNGTNTLSSNSEAIPLKLNIYPNPAVSTVNFEYSLNEVSEVKMEVFDNNGNKVSDLVNESSQMLGKYIIGFDATNLTPGMYMVQLKINDKATSQKLMIGG